MAADSTLVNAALKLGVSRAGANTPNMAPLAKAQVGISAGFLKMAEGAMGERLKKKEIKRVGKAKQLKVFENVFNNTLTSLYEQKEPLPQPFIDKLTSEIELLQEDFEAVNSYGKGDTSELARERARIMGELKRKSNEIINFRAGLEQFAIDRQNGLINEGLVKQRNISPAMMALDLKNFQKNYDAGNTEVGYDENGNMGITVRNYGVKGDDGVETFNGEDVFVTIESLNKTFPKINTQQDTAILERQTESAQTGKVDGSKPNAVYNYNREERYSEYFDGLDADEAISNIVARKIKGVGGMNPSFKDALLSDINIPLSILDTMFYDDDGGRVEVGMLFQDKLNLDKTVDENGNQVIDEKDRTLAEQMGGTAFEAFELNIDKMIDVITNVDNKAFDRKRTAGLLADYLTSMDEEKYNTSFDIAKVANSKNNKAITPPAQYQIGGPSAEVRNPATGLLEPTGYKYDKNGNLLFDDSGFLKDIKTGIQTKDYFGNRYEPVFDRETGKIKGFSIYDAIGDDKKPKYMLVEKILGFGYQAGLSVEFDPNNY